MNNKCLVTELKDEFAISNASYFKKVRMTGSNSANFRIGGTFTITSDTLTKIGEYNGSTIITEHNLPYTDTASPGQKRLKAVGADALDIFITTGGVTGLGLIEDAMLNGNELSLLQMTGLSELKINENAPFDMKMLKGNQSITSLYVKNTANAFGDIKAFKNTNIRSIVFDQGTPSGVIGDISSIATVNGLTKCQITSTQNIKGSIESFGECMSLTDLYFTGCPYVNGDIKALADLQYANGRTSGTLKVLVGNTGCSNSYSGMSGIFRVNITFTSSGYTMTAA